MLLHLKNPLENYYPHAYIRIYIYIYTHIFFEINVCRKLANIYRLQTQLLLRSLQMGKIQGNFLKGVLKLNFRDEGLL